MIIGALWFGFAVLVGIAAGARGRSGFGWFLLALVISPLLAVLFVAVSPDLRTRELLAAAAARRGDDLTAADDAALEAAVRRGRLTRPHDALGTIGRVLIWILSVLFAAAMVLLVLRIYRGA